MFDVAKIIQMTDALVNFVKSHESIYILPQNIFALSQFLNMNAFALFRRVNANLTAIITHPDIVIYLPENSSLLGYLVVNIDSVAKNIAAEVGIFYLVQKPVNAIESSLSISSDGKSINLPSFVLTPEEAVAIYDRLTVIRIIQQYHDDGMGHKISPEFLADRFTTGIQTFLNANFEDLKYIYYDRRIFGNPSYPLYDTAIVIQGPIAYENNYTAITSGFYRQWYPEAPIIISTWNNEATPDFKDFCARNSIVLLENDPPSNPGIMNVNFQLESSFRGVEYVQKNTSARYVLKCRTDQRINKTDFLVYFRNLLRAFSPNGDKTRARILQMSSFLINWIPFYNSDMLTFGTVHDVLKIYSIPHQTREQMMHAYHIEKRIYKIFDILHERVRKSKSFFKTFLQYRKFNIAIDKFAPPEIFIMKTYYKRHIGDYQPSEVIETFRRFVRDYIILVDAETILIDWKKYIDKDFNTHYPSYYFINRIGLNASSWLDIYLNFNSMK